jgi:hypothetical protein
MPWSPDQRIDRIRSMSAEEADALTASALGGAVIVRVNGSPFCGTKPPDLNTLRYSRYMDATGTHRLRGPKTSPATRRSSPPRIRWTSGRIGCSPTNII